MSRGCAVVAYGAPAWAQAEACIHALRGWTNALHITIATDRPKRFGGENVSTVHVDSEPYGRQAKLTLFDWTPYEHILYLDADTRVTGNVGAPFSILDHGWDLCITLSRRQGHDVLGHLPEKERKATITPDTLAFQAGVFYVARNERTARLFTAWLGEWRAWGPLDQGALLRAYREAPARVWLLGRAYNDGALVEHHYGAAARNAH